MHDNVPAVLLLLQVTWFVDIGLQPRSGLDHGVILRDFVSMGLFFCLNSGWAYPYATVITQGLE